MSTLEKNIAMYDGDEVTDDDIFICKAENILDAVRELVRFAKVNEFKYQQEIEKLISKIAHEYNDRNDHIGNEIK